MAMISLATVMSNPSSRGTPWALPAQTIDDVAQLAVVHIDHALPGDLRHIEAQFVALLDVVVDHGCQQVVGSADSMEITGEMKVDIFHRNDLRITAACRTPFDAEHGPQARLAQRYDYIFADAGQGIGQADCRCGLTLACGRRVYSGD